MNEIEKEFCERLTACEQSLKSEHKRLDHIEQLVESVRDMTVEMKHIREDIEDFKTDVEKISTKVTEIENKPAKRWDTAVVGVISAVISCVVGYMLSGIF